MVRRVCKPVSVLCVAALLAQGCGWVEQHQKAAIGVGVGAVAGGLVGAAVKGKKGAVVGALVGALAGGAIGAYLDHKDKAAEETNQAHDYKATQGVRVELAGVAADPNAVAPGGKVYLQATYAVMAPDMQQQLPVTETRVVTMGGTKVTELASNVTRTPGTYTSQVPIDLPPNAPKGQYQLTVSVAAAGQTAQRSSTFVVN